MPRQPRVVVPGVTQYVIQRGNNRAPIFRERADFERFLSALGEACSKQEIDVHSFVLMTNHVHIMITPRTSLALPLAIQCIGRRYVPYFNRKYDRTGGLWEGRYRALMLRDERHWLTCMRYVELNPVRAGMVDRPEEYPWSSYGTHALGRESPLLTPHPAYIALGGTPGERQTTWRTLCGAEVGV